MRNEVKFFSVKAGKNSLVNFHNVGNFVGTYHTIIPMSVLRSLTGIKEEMESPPNFIAKSIVLYLNADNYISEEYSLPADIMDFDDTDVIKKLNYLKAENCGVFIKPLGYRFKQFNVNKVYTWLNVGGVRRVGTRERLTGKFVNPLYIP